MLLAIDIGNTFTKIGVYQGMGLVASYKTPSHINLPAAEIRNHFERFLDDYHLNSDSFEAALISSVVPPLGATWRDVVYASLDLFAVFITSETPGIIPLHVDDPKTVGPDIIACASGGLAKYGPMTLIADMGTANKIILIDNEGAFAGLSIAPGLSVGAKGLKEKTAALPEIPLSAPSKAIGTKTEDCLLSGIVYGGALSIRGLAQTFEKEAGYPLTRILTGGNAPYCKEILDDFGYDENLLLDGINTIFQGGFNS